MPRKKAGEAGGAPSGQAAEDSAQPAAATGGEDAAAATAAQGSPVQGAKRKRGGRGQAASGGAAAAAAAASAKEQQADDQGEQGKGTAAEAGEGAEGRAAAGAGTEQQEPQEVPPQTGEQPGVVPQQQQQQQPAPDLASLQGAGLLALVDPQGQAAAQQTPAVNAGEHTVDAEQALALFGALRGALPGFTVGAEGQDATALLNLGAALGQAAPDGSHAAGMQALDPAAMAAAMAAAAALQPQQLPTPSLHTLGLRFRAHIESLDAQVFNAAREAGSLIKLTVQVVGGPPGMVEPNEGLPLLEVEVPADAELALLKRAVWRSSEWLLLPSSQLYRDISMRELVGDSSTLASFGLQDGHQLYLEILSGDSVSAAAAAMAAAADAAGAGAGAGAGGASKRKRKHSTIKGATGKGGSEGPGMVGAGPGGDGGEGGSPEAKEEGEDEGTPGARVKSNGARGSRGERESAPRTRFTIEEIQALVEGVRQYGTSWSRIKSAYPHVLDRRTQINLKDKWRNLIRGMRNDWKDERSPLTDELKERIKELAVLVHEGGPAAQQEAGVAGADGATLNLENVAAAAGDLMQMDPATMAAMASAVAHAHELAQQVVAAQGAGAAAAAAAVAAAAAAAGVDQEQAGPLQGGFLAAVQGGGEENEAAGS